MKEIQIGNYFVGEGRPLTLIAGPCVLEGLDRSLMIGQNIKDICQRLGIQYVFKASFDKANRTSYKAFRGPGLIEGLKMLSEIKSSLGVPVLSDIHECDQVGPASSVLDVMQIPAFLCRQTDLVWEIAKSGTVVNIKKGQFLSPPEIGNVIRKVEEAENHRILVTERGTTFGYNNLVVDMRGIEIMKQFGYPIVFDGTHSVQLPGGGGDKSAGQREYVPVLTRAAVGAGVNALFLEVHDKPEEALSDGPNMVRLSELEVLLSRLKKIYDAVRS